MDISSKPIRKLNEKYQNILFLHDELTRAGIPHELSRFLDGWIIIYEKDGVRIGDVTTHFFHTVMKPILWKPMVFQNARTE